MESLLNLCRLCTGPKQSPVDIFKDTDHNGSYSEIVQEMFQITLPNEDFLPTTACIQCIETLDQMRIMKIQITSAQDRFKQLRTEVPIDIKPPLLSDQGEDSNGDDNEVSYSPMDEITDDEEERSEKGSSIADDESVEKQMTEMNLLDCHLCEESSWSFTELEGHFQGIHKRPPYIFCCGQKFGKITAHDHIRFHIKNPERKITLKAEEKKKDPPKLYDCGTCGVRLKSKWALQKHLETHIPLDQRPNLPTCEKCGKTLSSERCLKQHMLIHQEQVSEQCPVCKKHYFQLKNHMIKYHKKDRYVTCTVCGILITRRSLANHMRMVHDKLKVPCKICGKEYSKSYMKLKHMKTHMGIRFPCPFCPYECSFKSNVNTHIRLRHKDQYEEYKASKLKELTEPKHRNKE